MDASLLLTLGAVLLALAAVVRGVTVIGARRLARERLVEAEAAEEAGRVFHRSLLAGSRLVPWGVGAIVFLLLHLGLEAQLPQALALAFVAGVLAWIFTDIRRSKRALRVEEQLADAIDLMVAALRSGASVLDGLDAAANEARAPLRPVLDRVVTRLRLGDDPASVFRAFLARLPLQTVRLFAFTMTVHWEVGGPLGNTLATVGKSIRDRVELTRRVRAQATEARFSVIGVLAITFGIAALMWRSDPARFEGFVGSSVGGAVVAGVFVMQGVGLFWMARLTRLGA